MNYDKLIQPHDIKIGERVFVISKIPAIESLAIYDTIAEYVQKFGMLGITMIPYATAKKILGYTALIDIDGTKISLDNDVVISDVFKNIGELHALIVYMAKENYDFFLSGKLLELLVPQETEAETV